jgi:Acyl-CoA carboxylase epsilon subunit
VSDNDAVTNNGAVTNDGAATDENSPASTESAHQPHEPHIQVLKGRPTPAELAALIAVLGSAGGAPEPAQPERTNWGLPVDRLRFAMSNYQRLTMQQMMHMKR